MNFKGLESWSILSDQSEISLENNTKKLTRIFLYARKLSSKLFFVKSRTTQEYPLLPLISTLYKRSEPGQYARKKIQITDRGNR